MNPSLGSFPLNFLSSPQDIDQIELWSIRCDWWSSASAPSSICCISCDLPLEYFQICCTLFCDSEKVNSVKCLRTLSSVEIRGGFQICNLLYTKRTYRRSKAISILEQINSQSSEAIHVHGGSKSNQQDIFTHLITLPFQGSNGSSYCEGHIYYFCC